jgi:hypothetical protein
MRDRLSTDIRHAFRALRRTPGFTAVSVITLALGIGASTAVYAVVDGSILRPFSPARSASAASDAAWSASK